MRKAFFGKYFLLCRKVDFYTKVQICAWVEFQSTTCVLSAYPKGPAGTEKSFIFNFEYVNQV